MTKQSHWMAALLIIPGLAESINSSTFHIYPDLEHGAYAEAKDFGERIYKFFSKQQ